MRNHLIIMLSFLAILGFKSDHSSIEKTQFLKKAESIVNKDTLGSFNGVVMIVHEDKVLFQCAKGYSDFERKKPMKMSNHFVIGSISKQFTAAMILRLYEQGKIQLNVPIKTYLNDLKMSWADSITISHLLTHTHGVYNKNVVSSFQAGKGFNYTFANFGYGLLAEIIEKVSNQSFAEVSRNLFKELGMKQSFHPQFYNKGILPKGYASNDSG
ncbi:MAG TPA: serine hydrolase domain-containing protein, partial [Bacteroidia bacterium]